VLIVHYGLCCGARDPAHTGSRIGGEHWPNGLCIAGNLLFTGDPPYSWATFETGEVMDMAKKSKKDKKKDKKGKKK